MEQIANLRPDEHFLPKFAIIGYSQEEDYYNRGHYFSYHNIVGAKLTAGMPLTKDTARNLFRCLEGDLIKFRFKGMLPKNPLGRAMFKKLKVYGGAEHPHAAQQPKALEL